MSNVINCSFGVDVYMKRTENNPAFIVKIPELNYIIYGGWKWGPNNPEEPSLIDTLIGAKQVLIADLEEYIHTNGENPDKAIKKIENSLSYLLGKNEINGKNIISNEFKFKLEDKTYCCTRTTKWINYSRYVKNSFEWYEEKNNENNDNGTLKYKFEFNTMTINDWVNFVNKRKSKQLAIDIVSKYS